MARVYVGTYRKYNNGNLAGAWLNLANYGNYRDFLAACGALHKNERDPEFMIQDSEDFPDGMDCGEWISEKEFNDVKQAMAEEEEKASSSIDRLNQKTLFDDLIDNEKTLFDEYMSEVRKVWQDKGMLDYCKKKYSSAVRLSNGGLLVFDKPKIENRFCFHDEGAQYELYKKLTSDEERMKKYFIQENLVSIDNGIKDLADSRELRNGLYTSRGKLFYIQRRSYSGETSPSNLFNYFALDPSEANSHPQFYPNIEPMSVADRDIILSGLRSEREKFVKRLDAYLKRYGTSKLHTWTYWADA